MCEIMAIRPSTVYPGQTDTSDPDGYPYGAPRNVTLAGDGTGFPLERSWVSDVFGFLQSLLVDAGLTPSDDPDKVGASQYLQAIQEMAVRRLDRIPLRNIRSIQELENDSSAANAAVVYGLLGSDPGWYVYCNPGGTGESLYRSFTRYNWTPVESSAGSAVDGASSETAIVIAQGTVGVGLARATDGETFSAPTSDDLNYQCVFYTGTNFLASAGGELRLSTDDGETFIEPTTEPEDWTSSGYLASQFARNPDSGRVIAVPTSGARFAYTDDDGDNWSEVEVTNDAWRGITYKDGRWFAVSHGQFPVYASEDDGLTWSQLTTLQGGDQFVPKLFTHRNYIIGVRGNYLWFSEDGEDWERGIRVAHGELAALRDWHYADGEICLACHSDGGPTYLALSTRVD